MVKRHSYFAYLGKYLKECVVYFGTFSNNSTITSFWHGINCRLVFPKTSVVFKGPTSTSDIREVCMNFAAGNGIIINLTTNCDMNAFQARYFDCVFLSDFGNESEKFFIAQENSSRLDFETIIFTKNNRNFKIYVMAMNIINVLFGELSGNIDDDEWDPFGQQIK